METPAFNILLVDDDAALTQMLAEYLEGEGFACRAVHNVAGGREAALSGLYDAVILDVMLPGGNGIDLLRHIRGTSDVPVIMLTAKSNDTERVIGLELGADDYVAKPYFPPELVARLRAVLRRPARRAANGDYLRLGALSLDAARRWAGWDGAPLELTATEFNLLEILIRAGERVSTKDELSLRLLGRRRESYDRSIDVHISNLRQKLERASGEALRIATLRGIGWRLEQAA
ncbi:response regulator transcription factor [Novosphingobium sediminicola]|uniref:Two-component system OmpR family response regulator n=1 Tax=Novosphingobium sediminicola TaxID=563162 RepID=A0A7W6CF29_9SPHN|nr:response regulator transcription factor [Novosphingobium sediminicola]MBB3953108.1 two-component system OmpR family response regulator [Novosphingobium sediminicola]